MRQEVSDYGHYRRVMKGNYYVKTKSSIKKIIERGFSRMGLIDAEKLLSEPLIPMIIHSSFRFYKKWITIIMIRGSNNL